MREGLVNLAEQVRAEQHGTELPGEFIILGSRHMFAPHLWAARVKLSFRAPKAD